LLDERFRLYLRGLPLEELRQLAFDFSTAAFEAGLKVLKPDGSYRAIPPSLTPAIENADSFAARSTLSRHLLSGLTKAADFFLGGAGKPEADAVFAGLAQWERQLVDQTWQYGHRVALARADFFTDKDGADRPLEMNSTIPAMPGYGDILARAFLAQLGRRAGLNAQEVDELWKRNGRNVDDLRRSLLAHLERFGSSASRPMVAVVARPQDAQSAELAYICRELNAEGMVAYRCTPDQIAFDDSHRPTLVNHPIDLIYRHVFVRNVPEGSAFGEMLREPERYRILNPPNSQLEMKSLFAELSEAGADPARSAAFGLDPVEISAAQRIPWSRRLRTGSTTDFDRTHVSDLMAFCEARPDALVLKRSWGYGGTSVLLGDEIDTPEGQQRANDLLQEPGSEPGTVTLGWSELLRRCAAKGGFVVQRKVTLTPRTHLVVGPDGPEWVSWYVDVSAFTNLGVDAHPTGGVLRGSKSRIVNIVTGGGLVPAIRADVMADLLQSLGV